MMIREPTRRGEVKRCEKRMPLIIAETQIQRWTGCEQQVLSSYLGAEC